MPEPADWAAAWQAMAAAVGRDFAQDQPERWGETIEAGALRRYLEPLELSVPVDEVPCTALASFALPLLWRAGDGALFTEASRDAQPRVTHVAGMFTGLEPPTTHFFAVESDADYLKTARVGDRLCRRGALLLSCMPKQTRVGRGAFICWQSEIIDQRRNVLARLRTTFFRYNLLGASA
nr:hypothetical protein [uncultured bacterium]